LNFSELGLNPALQRTVASMGLATPTPIQTQAIPAVLQGRDVWACAPTGSGKTLAYALPLVQLVGQTPRQTNFRRPIRCLVLADRLLELGFADELQAVLALLPAPRQTLLFSATFADDLSVWAHQGLRDPLRMRSDAIEVQDAPDIAQSAIAVDEKKRTALLRHLITTQGWQRVLVFVATRYACAHLASKLCTAGVRASALHGDMSQGGRQAALQDFKDNRIDVLVTTDLASRGIDIALLPVVVNYDLPRSADDYTHRIGRTARAGAQGQAVSFVSAHALAHWRLIQKRAQVQMPLEVVPDFEPTDEPVPAPGVGGIKGKRPSKKDKLRAASLQSES
jgi:superfamily II DNA/RNA helicase